MASAAAARASVEAQLSTTCRAASNELLQTMWSLLRDEIDIDDALVYAYAPPADNPFAPPGTLSVASVLFLVFIGSLLLTVMLLLDGISTTFSSIKRASACC
jgi:hypothetical protein